MSPLTICLIIFALMVIGFCSGKYSLATISLVSMMALKARGVSEVYVVDIMEKRLDVWTPRMR